MFWQFCVLYIPDTRYIVSRVNSVHTHTQFTCCVWAAVLLWCGVDVDVGWLSARVGQAAGKVGKGVGLGLGKLILYNNNIY